MEFNLNDPAFGPMGSLSLSFDQNVANAQRYLNALGFGPIKVDGLLGPETTEAMRQWSSVYRKQTWNGTTVTPTELAMMEQQMSAQGVKPPASSLAPATTTSTSTGEAPKQPIIKAFPWVTPAVLAGGVIVLSLVGYLWWRSSTGGGLFAEVDDDEDDVEEARERRHGRKAKSASCSRAPLVDFDEGKMVEAE